MRGLKLIFCGLFFLLGCEQNKRPEGILDEKRMVAVLSDLHIMDGYISTLDYSDSLRITGKNYYATIYKKHNISRNTYEKSLRYYSMQPALLDSMYTQVENIIFKKEIKLNKVRDAKLKPKNKK